MPLPTWRGTPYRTPTRRQATTAMLSHGSSPWTPRLTGVFDQTPPRFEISPPGSAPGSTGQPATVTPSGHLQPVKLQNSPQAGAAAAAARHQKEKGNDGLISIASLTANLPPGTMIVEESNLSATDFAKRFTALWQRTEAFAMAYANDTDAFGNGDLGAKTWKHLISCSNAETVDDLLGDEFTRYLLIARAANYFLTKKVLKVSVIKGFDTTADSELSQMLGMIYVDTPVVVRDYLANAMRDQFARVRSKPNFDTLYASRKDELVTELWSLLTPLLYDESTTSDSTKARADLAAILVDALNLALEIFTGTYDFRFEYAGVGALFDGKSMLNRDTCIGTDAKALAREMYRVKLAITPTIWFRNPEVNKDGSMTMVHLGNVILSAPRVEGK